MNKTNFLNLPIEIQLRIHQHLRPADLAALLTSHRQLWQLRDIERFLMNYIRFNYAFSDENIANKNFDSKLLFQDEIDQVPRQGATFGSRPRNTAQQGTENGPPQSAENGPPQSSENHNAKEHLNTNFNYQIEGFLGRMLDTDSPVLKLANRDFLPRLLLGRGRPVKKSQDSKTNDSKKMSDSKQKSKRIENDDYQLLLALQHHVVNYAVRHNQVDLLHLIHKAEEVRYQRATQLHRRHQRHLHRSLHLQLGLPPMDEMEDEENEQEDMYAEQFRSALCTEWEDVYLHAARKGKLAVMEFCLAVCRVDPSLNESAALRAAISLNRLDIVRVLLFKYNVDTCVMNHICMKMAVDAGYMDIIDALLNVLCGCGIHIDDDYPLRAACRDGRLPLVKKMVDLDAFVRCRGSEPMRLAAENGHMDAVRYLLSIKNLPHAYTFNFHPMMLQWEPIQLETVGLNVPPATGRAVLAEDSQIALGLMMAVDAAVGKGHHAIVKLLLQHMNGFLGYIPGLFINTCTASTKLGLTHGKGKGDAESSAIRAQQSMEILLMKAVVCALRKAIQSDSVEMVQLLIDAAVKVQITQHEAMHQLAGRGLIDILKTALRNTLPARQEIVHCLMECLRLGNPVITYMIIQMLQQLQLGYEGALLSAATHGQKDCARLLLDAGSEARLAAERGRYLCLDLFGEFYDDDHEDECESIDGDEPMDEDEQAGKDNSRQALVNELDDYLDEYQSYLLEYLQSAAHRAAREGFLQLSHMLLQYHDRHQRGAEDIIRMHSTQTAAAQQATSGTTGPSAAAPQTASAVTNQPAAVPQVASAASQSASKTNVTNQLNAKPSTAPPAPTTALKSPEEISKQAANSFAHALSTYATANTNQNTANKTHQNTTMTNTAKNQNSSLNPNESAQSSRPGSGSDMKHSIFPNETNNAKRKEPQPKKQTQQQQQQSRLDLSEFGATGYFFDRFGNPMEFNTLEEMEQKMRDIGHELARDDNNDNGGSSSSSNKRNNKKKKQNKNQQQERSSSSQPSPSFHFHHMDLPPMDAQSFMNVIKREHQSSQGQIPNHATSSGSSNTLQNPSPNVTTPSQPNMTASSSSVKGNAMSGFHGIFNRPSNKKK